MAKIMVLGAVLIALFAVSQASRLTVITTITEQPQCELRRGQQAALLEICKPVLIPPTRRPGYSSAQIMGQERYEKHMCCEIIEFLDKECRCKALFGVLGDLEKMGSSSQTEMQSARKAASSLPNQCNIGGPQDCYF